LFHLRGSGSLVLNRPTLFSRRLFIIMNCGKRRGRGGEGGRGRGRGGGVSATWESMPLQAENRALQQNRCVCCCEDSKGIGGCSARGH
jgi:hypothetical protein